MKTVLVVDDDMVTRKILKTVCQNLGYKVIEKASGEDALKVMNRKKVDVLISDWVMPGIDGIEVCEKVRSTSDKPPFIFLITGKKRSIGNYSEAKEAGADDFVYKPVDFYVFRNQLREMERRAA